MRKEIQETAKGLLDDKDNQAHAVSSPRPQLYGFRAHGGHAIKDVWGLLKNRPEVLRDCKCYTNIGYIGKNRLQVLLPRLCGALPAARTESRFARVVHQLRFSF